MARRPSDEWQRRVDEQAAELTRGSLSPADAYAARLWPESLRIGTDAALARFEHELRALDSPSDTDVLDVVQRLVLALNATNEQHERAGLIGIETGEREELCDYINASLEESGSTWWRLRRGTASTGARSRADGAIGSRRAGARQGSARRA